MKRQLEARSMAVEDLFAPPFLFASPAFQRTFAWTVDEAEQLLNDLQAAAADSAEDIYFIGAILLMRLPQPEDPPRARPAPPIFSGPERIFEIVDGQQRIVTLAILLAVLRDLLHQASPASTLSVRLKRALVAEGKRSARVLLRGGDGTLLDHATAEVGSCLVPPLASVQSDAQERLLTIRDFYVDQLKLLDRTELESLALFILKNCTLVAIVTNTIDRAYQMFTALNDAGKPLTRNDILKAELIGAIPAASRTLATETWDRLADRLGDNFEQLFSFVSTEAGRGSLPILEAIRAQVAANPKGAAGFLFDTLLPAGNIIDAILSATHTGAAQSAAINQTLRHLKWLPGQEWVAPLLSFWKRHSDKPDALLLFASALDRFAYGVRMLSLGNGKRLQRMAAVTREVTSNAPARGPWLSLLFNRDELRNINFGLRDLHGRSPHICRLVLQRLEEQLSGKPWLQHVTPATVEHILPLKIPTQSEWKAEFPDADARARFATCLGNLTLVSQGVNEAASNRDYRLKHAIYFGSDAAPITALTMELRDTKTWTATLIEKRLDRMSSGLNEIWRFDRP